MSSARRNCALTRGERVELRGFGTFSARHRPARDARNPRNGDHVVLGERRVPFFKACKLILDQLNREHQDPSYARVASRMICGCTRGRRPTRIKSMSAFTAQ